jgi:hypothetical protein
MTEHRPETVPETVEPETVEPGTVEPGTVEPGTVEPGTVERGAERIEKRAARRAAQESLGPLPARLAIELVIGLGLAAVLLLVAWASSNTIHFVYGGY